MGGVLKVCGWFEAAAEGLHEQRVHVAVHPVPAAGRRPEADDIRPDSPNFG